MKPDAPGRVSRRVQADRDLRPRRAAVRTPAAAGPAGAPPGRRQLAGPLRPRHRRPPRRLLLQPHRPRAGPDLPPAAQQPQAVPRRLAVHRLRRGQQAAAAPASAVADHPAAEAGIPRIHAARPVRRPPRPGVRSGLSARQPRPADGVRRPCPDPGGRRGRRPASVAPPTAGRRSTGPCREAEQTAPTRRLGQQQERAFTLLSGPRTQAAFDLEQEPAARARALRRRRSTA